jgi:hypothetical protein
MHAIEYPASVAYRAVKSDPVAVPLDRQH